MTPQELFVTRLRRHRQRHRLALEEIAADTRVKVEFFEALEQNQLETWPRGLYARAWVRAYASAVGLDPGDTVDEFCRLFPQGDRRVEATLTEMAAVVGHRSEYRHEVEPEAERRAAVKQVYSLRKPTWRDAVGDLGRLAWARLVGDRAMPNLRVKGGTRTT
jgi:hypothetical protein